MSYNLKEALKLLAFVTAMVVFCAVSPVGKNLTVFAVVLSFLVCIHELGHYIWFKKAGVKVNEFAIGMGPQIASFQLPNGERWSFRALLIGGYVSPQGSGKARDDAQEDGDYWAATPWGRMKAILAGPLVNIVFAFVALTAALMIPTSHHLEFVVDTDSAVAQSGVETNNRITAVNGVEVETADDYHAAMETVDTEVSITYVNTAGESRVVTVFNFDKANPSFGVNEVRTGGPGMNAVKASVTSADALVKSVPRFFVAIKDMVVGSDEAPAEGDETNTDEPQAGMAGPNKFGEIMRTQMSGGLFAFLATMASLSLILGISNLIPLLPLDGGHVVATTAEMLGKPIPEKIQKVASALVAIPLFGLTIVWLFWDVIEKFI